MIKNNGKGSFSEVENETKLLHIRFCFAQNERICIVSYTKTLNFFRD